MIDRSFSVSWVVDDVASELVLISTSRLADARDECFSNAFDTFFALCSRALRVPHSPATVWSDSLTVWPLAFASPQSADAEPDLSSLE